ncbi:hypothetical protein LCGC14_0610590 [marine sediment metagenome]|uniref:DUF1353 domain-containing protein n=1 Tax=marine sediment metagenome TaxID=412755 RepID=A0A0F9R7Y9_9ZZZZ
MKFSNLHYPLPLRTLYLGKEKHLLLSNFMIRWDGGKITARQGFIWDGASIPHRLRGIVSKAGDIQWAACIHDWLYLNRVLDDNTIIYRAFADRILLEGMKEVPVEVENGDTTVRVPWYRRGIVYSGVRIGGWLVWNRRNFD